MPRSTNRPFFENEARSELAGTRREIASHYSRGYAARRTETNTDEEKYAEEGFPASFTKGLPHDAFGLLENPDDHVRFVWEINQQDATDFSAVPRGIGQTAGAGPARPALTTRADGEPITWRGWESPRAGHYFDLQGPDADAVGMPPAPELGSEELIAEMAEVYALALLRDVPISRIAAGEGEDAQSGVRTADVLAALSSLSWFTDDEPSTLTLQERRRRAARRLDHGPDFPIDDPPDDAAFDPLLAFRGSGPGAKRGPYVSQFMLLGTSRSPDASGVDITDSAIEYGTQVIDQKVRRFAEHQDHMLHWNAAVDVQNGADFGYANRPSSTRRFVATPRDLATYVRYDALYQAYLNACLIMLGSGGAFTAQKPLTHPLSERPGPGFPDRGSGDSRQAFAAFGGPHVLSLVTEVATRCLKAVRRQKFNYHRRARPERIGELLTLYGTAGASGEDDVSGRLGPRTRASLKTMSDNLAPLLALVESHNAARLAAGSADTHLDFGASADPAWFDAAANRLLPMAFAEGSPMHPSYGAGHATVAGGCVTMLKAFFHTVERGEDNRPRAVRWPDGLPVVQARDDGSALERLEPAPALTIAGELDKLAANISIARNMAGVHFYTDYYESLRMGERVATGILIEQMRQYDEPVEMDFQSFDGDHVHILKSDHDYADPRLFVHDSLGEPVEFGDWWTRHLGEGPGAADALPVPTVEGRAAERALERRPAPA